MTESVWVDANVLVRFLTKDPATLFRRAQELVRRAETGSVLLRVSTVVVAEVVWILGSYYRLEQRSIADLLRGFLRADGLTVQDGNVVFHALELMAARNVDFVDAYLAAAALRAEEAVASFDEDFERLGVRRIG